MSKLTWARTRGKTKHLVVPLDIHGKQEYVRECDGFSGPATDLVEWNGVPPGTVCPRCRKALDENHCDLRARHARRWAPGGSS